MLYDVFSKHLTRKKGKDIASRDDDDIDNSHSTVVASANTSIIVVYIGTRFVVIATIECDRVDPVL
jgi:hypothetical protein